MREKIEKMYDSYGLGITIVILTSAVIIALGMALGYHCLVGWLLMLVVNAIAGYAVLNLWTAAGIVLLVTLLCRAMRPRAKKGA